MCGCSDNNGNFDPTVKVDTLVCYYTLEDLYGLREKADLIDKKYPEINAVAGLETQINAYSNNCNLLAEWIFNNIQNFTNGL